MKTEAQFNMLAKVYRTEVRWRGVLLFPIVFIGAIFFISLGSLFEPFTSNHFGFILTGIFLVVSAWFGLNTYVTKSKESLACKLDLICPSCSHVLRPDDHHMLATTDKCPWCRNKLFS